MLKIILFVKRIVNLLFILISAIGFGVSVALNILILLGYNSSIYIVPVMLGMPIVFTPSFIITIIKIDKDKGTKKKRYWNSFEPAMKNVPNWMISILSILIFYIIFMIFLSSLSPDGLLLSTDYFEIIVTIEFMIFYYVPFLVYLSSFLEVYRKKQSKKTKRKG
ncbi:MAG: hypothetical protein K0R84_327 [Clostridia bacterium]|jgi:hypothetical protein|nr:hypothetical protein [Clostridia bacterium]